MLMHEKLMHELHSLLLHIPTYLDVMRSCPMFYIDFRDFLNNPLSFGFNSVWHKTLFFSVFDFLGATGLANGQGQRARLGNSKRNKMS
jgi:hypothetical protein